MTFALNDEQRILSDSARTFLEERAPVSHLRALRDRGDPLGYSPELWQAFGTQGYAAILVPEADGGLGLGVVAAAIVAEQIGHTLAPVPFLSTAVLSALALAAGGSQAQREKWLPRIAAAEAIVALATDERGRHRSRPRETIAVREGDGWRIDGRKVLVVDGHVADALVVSARVGDAVGLFLVPKDVVGVEVERTAMVDAHNAARVSLANVRLPDGALVGTLEGGAASLDRALDAGRVVVAAELLGLAQEVFVRTIGYLLQRKQFDRLIGEFQALQHRAAELFCDIELTRALVRQAAASVDRGAPDAALRVAQAKARACLTAGRAVQEGVQMHGGIGMTDELDVGLFMKRARVLQELLGDAAFQMDRAAVLSGY